MNLTVKHDAVIAVDDYQFHDSLQKEVLSKLKNAPTLPPGHSHVKSSFHTIFHWEPDNIVFRNLKNYIINEVSRIYGMDQNSDGTMKKLECYNFWGMVYKKGDFAYPHVHGGDYSFVYFAKSKWYHSPLVFTVSGKRIRPKEGRYVIFPAYLRHSVPKHRFGDERITLSGNILYKSQGRNL